MPSHSGECSYILLVYPSTLNALTLWGVFLHTVGLPWHTECPHTLGSVLTHLLVYPSTLSTLTLWGVFLHTFWFTLPQCRVLHTLGSILTHYLVYSNTGEHLYIQEYIYSYGGWLSLTKLKGSICKPVNGFCMCSIKH